jgi:hypothetical protein
MTTTRVANFVSSVGAAGREGDNRGVGMNAWAWVVVAFAVVLILATAAFLIDRRRRQSHDLRDWFGQYERRVESTGRPRRMEREPARSRGGRYLTADRRTQRAMRDM